MIEVKFQGQTGNQLFQYAFGRLLAEEMCYWFATSTGPLVGFEELHDTFTNINGFQRDSIAIDISSQCSVVLSRDRLHTLHGFKIILLGYFERASHYLISRNRINRWFNPITTQNTIAIHVRGGDGKHHSPPASYYIEAHNLIFNSPEYTGLPITIYTDDVNDDVVKKLANMFSAKVQHGDVREDFDAMRSASHLIIGNSTFAWWAAFLSNAKVIQPEPTSGFRSWQMPNTDLRVPEWTQVKYTP